MESVDDANTKYPELLKRNAAAVAAPRVVRKADDIPEKKDKTRHALSSASKVEKELVKAKVRKHLVP